MTKCLSFSQSFPKLTGPSNSIEEPGCQTIPQVLRSFPLISLNATVLAKYLSEMQCKQVVAYSFWYCIGLHHMCMTAVVVRFRVVHWRRNHREFRFLTGLC